MFSLLLPLFAVRLPGEQNKNEDFQCFLIKKIKTTKNPNQKPKHGPDEIKATLSGTLIHCKISQVLNQKVKLFYEEELV